MRKGAEELVALAPDVILAHANAPVGTLRQATRIVPIVFPVAGDPVATRFVDSLVRPGGNITGFINVCRRGSIDHDSGIYSAYRANRSVVSGKRSSQNRRKTLRSASRSVGQGHAHNARPVTGADWSGILSKFVSLNSHGTSVGLILIQTKESQLLALRIPCGMLLRKVIKVREAKDMEDNPLPAIFVLSCWKPRPRLRGRRCSSDLSFKACS